MNRLRALLLALALCLSLSACWSEDELEADEGDAFWETEQDAEPDAETKAFTTFALPYLPAQTLDPILAPDGVQQTVCALLYEGLFALDETFTPQNALCTSYVCEDGATSYTFTLRDDVTFSDGSALTANDVLATYRRAAVSERYGARFANVASVRVVRGALVITLAAPDSAFPALLDIPVVKAGTEERSVPLGTGPYLFATDEGGAYLLRNENHRTAPPLPRIALVAAKDNAAAAHLFTAGSVHLLSGDLLSASPLSAISGARLTDAPGTALLFLGFNCTREATGDAALRRAMGGAIDRAAVCELLLAGHAEPAQFPLSPRAPLYPAALESEPLSTENYAAATDALGLSADGPLELKLLVNSENPFKVSLAEYLAARLTNDAVNVSVEELSFTDYLAALAAGSFDLYLGEVRLGANWDLSPLLTAEGTLNYGGFADPWTEELLARFLAEGSQAAARSLCRRLASEAPLLPIAFKSVSLLTPEGLAEDMRPTAADPFSQFDRWTLSITEES